MDDNTLNALWSIFKPLHDAAHIALYHWDYPSYIKVWDDWNGLECYCERTGMFHTLILPECDEEIKGWLCETLGLVYDDCDLVDLATGEVLC